MSNTSPSRRSFLRVGSATLASTTVLTSAALANGPDADAELMSMAARFDAARLKARELQPDYSACIEAANANFEAWKESDSFFSMPRKGSRRYQEWWDTYSGFYRATDQHPIHAAWNELSAVSEPLAALPASTPEGLALKARHALEYVLTRADEDEPKDELDFDKAVVLSLAEDLCRLAGVDTYGRPLSREEA